MYDHMSQLIFNKAHTLKFERKLNLFFDLGPYENRQQAGFGPRAGIFAFSFRECTKTKQFIFLFLFHFYLYLPHD